MFNQYHHLPLVRFLRSTSRRLGILAIVKRWQRQNQTKYEEAFHAALRSSISNGDVVWDVGANVGLYTSQFLDWTGPTGLVVAFEPLPSAFNELTKRIALHSFATNAVAINAALANFVGTVSMEAGHQHGQPNIPTTMHISDVKPTSPNTPDEEVRVLTADDALHEANVKQPNVTKIDVEGYEEDVILGGRVAFTSKDSRHILIEIHFTRLEQRGLPDAPSKIVKHLKEWGYKCKWIDASHLHAFRPEL